MSGGLPDIDALASYGGALANYAPVVDPSTDEDANWRNLYAMNVAAMTHMSPRAFCAFIGNATTPTDPTSFVHDSVWGSSVAVKPTVAHSSTGVYTVTWPTTVTDELGNTHTINLRRCLPSFEGATPYDVSATVTSPNVVTFRVWNTAGTANDGVGTTFVLFVF